MNIKEDDEVPDKSQVEREHLDRVKEHMISEEEGLKATRIIKGVDKTKYKDFRNIKYVPPPKPELSDEMKLVLARRYQALAAFIGLIGFGMIFFIIYDPKLRISIFDNFIIVLKLYSPTLYFSIFKNYLVIEMNFILLLCSLMAVGIVEIINFQHKHDRISDRISAGQSNRRRTRKVQRYNVLITTMAVVGLGILFLDLYDPALHLPIFENFFVDLSIYDSMLHLSILKSIVIKMNLILLGGALAATSLGIVSFRYIREN